MKISPTILLQLAPLRAAWKRLIPFSIIRLWMVYFTLLYNIYLLISKAGWLNYWPNTASL